MTPDQVVTITPPSRSYISRIAFVVTLGLMLGFVTHEHCRHIPAPGSNAPAGTTISAVESSGVR